MFLTYIKNKKGENMKRNKLFTFSLALLVAVFSFIFILASATKAKAEAVVYSADSTL